MSEQPLNKSGASALGHRPRPTIQTFDGFCNEVGKQPRYLQTTMNVSIFLSKLLIHSAHLFYPSTFLVRILRA
jgi:hypothetical protein